MFKVVCVTEEAEKYRKLKGIVNEISQLDSEIKNIIKDLSIAEQKLQDLSITRVKGFELSSVKVRDNICLSP